MEPRSVLLSSLEAGGLPWFEIWFKLFPFSCALTAGVLFTELNCKRFHTPGELLPALALSVKLRAPGLLSFLLSKMFSVSSALNCFAVEFSFLLVVFVGDLFFALPLSGV